MSLKSPLGRVLGLGSAHDGTGHWWAQRVTGVALVLLGIWFTGSLAGLENLGYETMLAFVAEPLNGVLLTLLALTVAWHSQLGVQVVIEDYVHAGAAKVAALVLSRFAHVFIAALSVWAILRIGLGA